jgi:hypothetical protein
MDLLNGNLTDIIAHLGIGGSLALIVFYYARQDANRHRAEWKASLSEGRELTERLLTIIAQNSEAITKNTAVTEASEQAIRELRAEVTSSHRSTRSRRLASTDD